MGTAAASGGMSLAATGLQMYGTYLSSRGTAAGDQYRAEVLDRAAQYGDLQAKQVNAQMTRNLAISLGKLDSIRAAGHANPFSPTGAAVRGTEEEIGTENKNIKVTGYMEQAQLDESEAAYLRSASNNALLAGDIGMAGQLFGAGAGALQSSGTPSPIRGGGSTFFSPF